MPWISVPQAFERFQTHASNSSHFVWFLDAKLQFFETRQGWIFASRNLGGVTLFALDPISPVSHEDPSFLQGFEEAWREIETELQPGLCAFVAVYPPTRGALQRLGFKFLEIGREPWVDLRHCIPRGNSGKGVRAARNQALRAGISVEEHPAKELLSDTSFRRTVLTLYTEQTKRRLVSLPGFMNSADPLASPEERRYFLAQSPRGPEGYLIATRISGRNGYFLEDLVLCPKAKRGTGELLTLEAMVALGESGAKTASLGVVSGIKNLPQGQTPMLRFVFRGVQKLVKAFYNLDGLELYRKRFKPERWEPVSLAVRSPQRQSVTMGEWIRVVWAVFRAFEPRLQPSLSNLGRLILSPLRSYPLAFGVVSLSLLSFLLINQGGNLPPFWLHRWGFSASAPPREWLLRSLTSDFLSFNAVHFWQLVPLMGVLLVWAERTQRRRFLWTFVCASFLLDDFFNYWLVIKPFNYFHPPVFAKLVAHKDVGGSLTFSALIGLQLVRLKAAREPLFVLICLIFVFGFAFSSGQFHFFVLNLNHFLLLALGYLVGKGQFHWEQARSRRVAKGKPPEAKSVASQVSRK